MKLTIAALVLLSGTLASTAANATVIFTVTDSEISADIGYEDPGGDRGLLYVDFDEDFSGSESGSLLAGDSFSFVFGTVNFLDEDGPAGKVECSQGECDNLGVTATFIFTSPNGIDYVLTATGTGTDGPIGEPSIDYALVWAPLTVDFGAGGDFMIDINSLTFSDNNEGAKDLIATITLVTEPQPVKNLESVEIPEPGTLMIFGIGLLGLGVMRRRKQIV